MGGLHGRRITDKAGMLAENIDRCVYSMGVQPVELPQLHCEEELSRVTPK